MPSKRYWPPEKVRALRDRLTVMRDEEKVPMNQTDFGELLGGYIQPTISNWEKYGCTSRRGCADLERVEQDLKRNEKKEVSKLANQYPT